VVQRDIPLPVAQLLRAGGAPAPCPGRGEEPLLPSRPELGPVPPDRARDAGDHHRLAGRDFRRLLADAPGGAARLQPTAPHRAYLVARDRPDLRPRRQLGPDAADLCIGVGLRLVQQHRRCLRRGPLHADAHHDADVLRDEPRSLALEHPASGARRRAVPLHGRPVLRRQRAEDSLRRLGPPGHCARRVHADDHLEAGPRDPRQAHAGEDGAPEDAARRSGGGAADPRARHGRLHVRHRGRHAAGARAQPGPQQGAARESRVPDRGDARCTPLDTRIEGTTFFLGRETLVAAERPGMAEWRAKLFAFMSRNALRATAFFKIPANQVFEVGAQVEL